MQKQTSDIRFPLGNELYLTVGVFMGKPLVHIRRFMTSQSQISGKTLVKPTKVGICLNEAQLSQLILNLPSVLAVLKATASLKDSKAATGDGDRTTQIAPEAEGVAWQLSAYGDGTS